VLVGAAGLRLATKKRGEMLISDVTLALLTSHVISSFPQTLNFKLIHILLVFNVYVVRQRMH